MATSAITVLLDPAFASGEFTFSAPTPTTSAGTYGGASISASFFVFVRRVIIPISVGSAPDIQVVACATIGVSCEAATEVEMGVTS